MGREFDAADSLVNTEGRAPSSIHHMTINGDLTYAMLLRKCLAAAYSKSGCPIAQLSIPRSPLIFETVGLFLIDPDKEEIMRSPIQGFAPTIPNSRNIAVLYGLSQ